MKLWSFIFCLSLALQLSVQPTYVAADDDDGVPDIHLGSEHSKYNKPRRGMGGGSTKSSSSSETSVLERVLLYLPNRFLDLIDIFRVDVGVGPALGGVVRITKYGQAGYRAIDPGSLRLGLMGRREPFMVESSSEYGIGPSFHESKDRDVETMEIGLGGDLFLVGGYLGIDLYQIPDFFLGWFGVDYAEDDLK